jgi:3-phytase
VRRFSHYSGTAEVEAVAIDDELGFVYYADEEYGIHKWHADPDHPEAGRELAVFGRDGFRGQREGLAVVAGPDGTGFILCSDQIPGGSELRLFPREARRAAPHAHDPPLAVVRTTGAAIAALHTRPRLLPGTLAGAAAALAMSSMMPRGHDKRVTPG